MKAMAVLLSACCYAAVFGYYCRWCFRLLIFELMCCSAAVPPPPPPPCCCYCCCWCRWWWCTSVICAPVLLYVKAHKNHVEKAFASLSSIKYKQYTASIPSTYILPVPRQYTRIHRRSYASPLIRTCPTRNSGWGLRGNNKSVLVHAYFIARVG